MVHVSGGEGHPADSHAGTTHSGDSAHVDGAGSTSQLWRRAGSVPGLCRGERQL